MYISTINATDEKHLEDVVALMQIMGPPDIMAFYDGDSFVSLEGSHRLAAAYQLGLTPNLILHNKNDWIGIEHLDEMFHSAQYKMFDALSAAGFDTDECEMKDELPVWAILQMLDNAHDMLDFEKLEQPYLEADSLKIDYADAFARLRVKDD